MTHPSLFFRRDGQSVKSTSVTRFAKIVMKRASKDKQYNSELERKILESSLKARTVRSSNMWPTQSQRTLLSPERFWLESGRLSNQIYRLSSRELRSLSDHLAKLKEPTRPLSRSRRLKDPEPQARTHARREQVTSHSYRVS